MEVGVLAQLLDAAMEVAEDRVEVDDLLAVDLHHDPEHAMRRGVVRPDVDEHLAVLERVELRFPLGAWRVRRDRLEDAEVAVEPDSRVVSGLVRLLVPIAVGVRGGRHLDPGPIRLRAAAADQGGRRRVARGVGAFHVADAGAG
jgi:hypothetical protein